PGRRPVVERPATGRVHGARRGGGVADRRQRVARSVRRVPGRGVPQAPHPRGGSRQLVRARALRGLRRERAARRRLRTARTDRARHAAAERTRPRSHRVSGRGAAGTVGRVSEVTCPKCHTRQEAGDADGYTCVSCGTAWVFATCENCAVRFHMRPGTTAWTCPECGHENGTAVMIDLGAESGLASEPVLVPESAPESEPEPAARPSAP